MKNINTTATSLLSSALLLSSLFPTLLGCQAHPKPSSPSAPQESADLEATKATMSTVRFLGSALMSWYLDESRGKELDSSEPAWSTDRPLPLISEADMRKRVVPNYLSPTRTDVDFTDGWGNEIEVRVNPRVLEGEVLAPKEPALTLISRGADGKFAGTSYRADCFLVAEKPGTDTVWTDGYFLVRASEDPNDESCSRLRTELTESHVLR